MRPKTVNQVHFNDINTKIINYQNEKKLLVPPTVQFDNERWDDGLNGDFDKGKFQLKKTKKSLKIDFFSCC
jgi:hypothetical protein